MTEMCSFECCRSRQEGSEIGQAAASIASAGHSKLSAAGKSVSWFWPRCGIVFEIAHGLSTPSHGLIIGNNVQEQHVTVAVVHLQAPETGVREQQSDPLLDTPSQARLPISCALYSLQQQSPLSVHNIDHQWVKSEGYRSLQEGDITFHSSQLSPARRVHFLEPVLGSEVAPYGSSPGLQPPPWSPFLADPVTLSAEANL